MFRLVNGEMARRKYKMFIQIPTMHKCFQTFMEIGRPNYIYYNYV